jgi:hypothetical protein
MNLSQLATMLGKASVYTRDLNAIKRGRFKERIFNRVAGRVANRVMRGVWK